MLVGAAALDHIPVREPGSSCCAFSSVSRPLNTESTFTTRLVLVMLPFVFVIYRATSARALDRVAWYDARCSRITVAACADTAGQHHARRPRTGLEFGGAPTTWSGPAMSCQWTLLMMGFSFRPASRTGGWAWCCRCCPSRCIRCSPTRPGWGRLKNAITPEADQRLSHACLREACSASDQAFAETRDWALSRFGHPR